MNRIDIKDFIAKHYSGDEWFYYPNPGNAGDGLIAAATYQLFEDLNIKYSTINRNKKFCGAGKTIIYSGGGNLVRRGQHARNFLTQIHKNAKKIIILPHTIEGNEDLLASFGENSLIIAREVVTYKHLERNAKKAKIFLADDIAFSLDVLRTLNYKVSPIYRNFRNILGHPNRNSILIGSKFFLKIMLSRFLVAYEIVNLKARKGYRTLNAFRTDIESMGFRKPKDNIDISKWFSFGTESKESVFASSKYLLSFLNLYEVVKTDRLHACVGAALLNKKVHFYSNDYYKCKAVFDFSIQNRYPNVIWEGNRIR
jgi:exopolysaccharide biosynthesis predicted pyruvyltransferase EpsI